MLAFLLLILCYQRGMKFFHPYIHIRNKKAGKVETAPAISVESFLKMLIL